jgi:hypothetical protein
MAATTPRFAARPTSPELTTQPSTQDPTADPRGDQPARAASSPCTPRPTSPTTPITATTTANRWIQAKDESAGDPTPPAPRHALPRPVPANHRPSGGARRESMGLHLYRPLDGVRAISTRPSRSRRQATSISRCEIRCSATSIIGPRDSVGTTLVRTSLTPSRCTPPTSSRVESKNGAFVVASGASRGALVPVAKSLNVPYRRSSTRYKIRLLTRAQLKQQRSRLSSPCDSSSIRRPCPCADATSRASRSAARVPR